MNCLSPWSRKESDMTEQLNLYASSCCWRFDDLRTCLILTAKLPDETVVQTRGGTEAPWGGWASYTINHKAKHKSIC